MASVPVLGVFGGGGLSKYGNITALNTGFAILDLFNSSPFISSGRTEG